MGDMAMRPDVATPGQSRRSAKILAMQLISLWSRKNLGPIRAGAQLRAAPVQDGEAPEGMETGQQCGWACCPGSANGVQNL